MIKAVDTTRIVCHGHRQITSSRVRRHNRPLHRHQGSELGPALGAARLAILATNQADLTENCSRPEISETLEPVQSHVPYYQAKQDQYRDLHQKLTDVF